MIVVFAPLILGSKECQSSQTRCRELSGTCEEPEPTLARGRPGLSTKVRPGPFRLRHGTRRMTFPQRDKWADL